MADPRPTLKQLRATLKDNGWQLGSAPRQCPHLKGGYWRDAFIWALPAKNARGDTTHRQHEAALEREVKTLVQHPSGALVHEAELAYDTDDGKGWIRLEVWTAD